MARAMKGKKRDDAVWALLNATTDAAMLSNHDGDIIALNDAMARRFGKEVDDLLGKKVYEFIPKQVLDRRLTMGEKAAERQGAVHFEDERAGRTLQNSIFPVYDEQGKIKQFAIFSKDITEQRQARHALEESERRYQNIIEHASEIFYIIGPDAKIQFATPQCKRTLGYTQEEISGMKWTDMLTDHPINQEAKKISRDVFAKGVRPKLFEIELYHKSGEKVLLEIDESPVLDETGRVVASSGAARDITKRKEAQEALEKSLKTADDLMRAIPAGIFIYEYRKGKLRLINANKEAERLTGIKLEEWKGKEFDKIWPNAKRRGISKDYYEAARTGVMHESEETEYADERLQGAFRVHAFSLPDSKLAVAFEDITDRKRAELELVTAKDQLQSIVNSTHELIIATDQEGTITTWNRSAMKRTGHQERQMRGKNVLSEPTTGLESLFELLRATLEKRRTYAQEHSIKDADGNRIILRSSTSRIGKDQGAVIVSRDITDERSAYRKLEPGKAYYSSKESFDDLLRQCGPFIDNGYEVLCTTRDADLSRMKGMHVVVLTDGRNGRHETCSTVEELEASIDRFLAKHEKAVIVLSRLEYFSITDDFMTVAKFLLKFHNKLRKREAVGIIHKGSMHKDEQSFFREEFDAYPETEGVGLVIDPRKKAILRFIEERNEQEVLVNYTAIIKEFSLARMTARSWLRELQQLNLIVVRQAGKVKRITLTAKGKEFLRKQFD